MLFHYVCVCIADRDRGALLDNLQLAVSGNHLAAAVLVADKTLSKLVELFTIVALALSDDFDRVDA
jgi:hypothetical protein